MAWRKLLVAAAPRDPDGSSATADEVGWRAGQVGLLVARLCPKQAVVASSVPATRAEVVYGGVGVDGGNAGADASSAPLSEP